MRLFHFKSTIVKSALAASVLLLAGGAAYGQSISLTAGPATATMPDGSTVPMWGYSCGAATSGSTATCAALNTAVAAAQAAVAAGTATAAQTALASSWSPVIITVPYSASGTSLTINLSNNLAFAPAGSTKPTNFVPTSLTIVGQVGGGLGSPLSVASPAHATLNNSWPIANTGSTFTPPAQGARVQSFGAEIAATGATLATGQLATGSPLTWNNLRPGTYLIESGTHPSIQVPMGLYGIVVVTNAPTSTTAPGTAYPATTSRAAVTYNADVPLVMGEIDPVQNGAVNAAVHASFFNETAVWSGQPGGCGNPATVFSATTPACYPPAVNYTPTYYLFNGVAFNRTSATASLFPASVGTVSAPVAGNVLVRLVNAGLRMHVPAIVGSTTGANSAGGMTLIAEDGNLLPGVPRVQSEVFMAAGKTYDVMINVPAVANAPALPIFDRELSLSGNAVNRDAGMLAYIGVNGATVPAAPAFIAAVARPDTYNALVAGQVLSVLDPAKGVIANDTNVSGVTLLTGPTNGSVTLNSNGTFTYTPTGTATSDSFTYCANGAVTAGVCSSGITATVSLGATAISDASGVSCAAPTFSSNVAGYYASKSPGVLGGCADKAKLPLTVAGAVAAKGATPAVPLVVAMTGSGTGSASIDANGGFTATASAAGTYTFSFTATNALGVQATATATITFATPSNLAVTVLDGADKKSQITDYRWIIEEDRTFYVDPKCTTNPLPAGCPTINNNSASTTTAGSSQFNYGTSFHTAFMPVVATGCTGPLSCESGQSVQGVSAACDVGDGSCRTSTSGTLQKTISLPSQVHLDPSKRYYISVLPGDAANPFNKGYLGAPNCASTPATTTTPQTSVPNGTCGHGMGGAPIGKGQAAVMVLAQPSPYPSAKLTVYVFEDDYPLNGEYDAGGGVDVIAANEPGLGGFQVTLQDDAGATGDATGTPTYDMSNQPLSNSLAGTLDPVTGFDACPVSSVVTNNMLVGINVSASLSKGSPTFTLATVPLNLTVGTTLADTSGAIPSGTTVTNIVVPTTGPATITMSANASASVSSDTITVTGSQKGITGMIVTCPKYESDGKTLSPLVGQAIVANLYPGRYGVQAIPGADRIARGEEWLQTNTLDGQKAHDSFLRIGEPAYFQEYGPAGYHVSIGFANPQIINNRRHNGNNSGWCDLPANNSLTTQTGAPAPALACNNTVTGQVTTARMSRTPDERLYGSGSRDAYSFTQCYVALSDPDGATFAFTKCDQNGNFKFAPTSATSNDGIPAGSWMLTIFDQWNDQIVDGISTPVLVNCAPTNGGGLCTTANSTGTTVAMGEIGAHQWQANIYTKTFLDTHGTGVYKSDDPGLALVSTNVRFRDGSFSNFNNTDLGGSANFNEVFPLFNWYVIETDTTRYKSTGVHVVYDAGGPADQSSPGGTPCAGSTTNPCGASTIGKNLANTYEAIPLPNDLRIPGAVYCTDGDCATASIASGPVVNGSSPGASGPSCTHSLTDGTVSCTSQMSTGRIDPPYWFGSYGWQGYSGQGNFLEFGKVPYAAATATTPAETGGIHGHVVYASTRPYDNPALLLQNSWESQVPGVTINLYQEGVAADGVTPTLTLVDTTTTTSWDDWAQGFRSDGKPNMNCAGQSTTDPFYYGLQNQPQWLDFYNKGGPSGTLSAPLAALPYGSQFKCYDGMHTWNQLQPAPYDGMYNFPSAVSNKIDPNTGKLYVNPFDPVTGKPQATNCTICIPNPDKSDPYRYGMPMLPAGKYVVEVVVPPGFELVKEEDKNILIGDNFIGPAQVQFPGLATNIFILPDQAAIGAYYNAASVQNPTQNLGRNLLPNSEGDTGSVETYWPCVGAARQVPDYISLFPQSQEVAPFAGAIRNLCDRKEVTLNPQASALAKFYIFTPTHISSRFTGIILDDFTSEFDPYSPQFGEKFAPSYLPVSVKDWAGNEISRVYSDQFGLYNGLSYSTWEVNPPNPTGYAPTMMVNCMNDSGYGTIAPWWDPAAVTAGTTSNQPDPFFQPGYSQFCYELSYMPGRTGYFDTPVTPNAAFTDGYNHPDCAYPNSTPAIASVTGDVAGPWVQATGTARQLKITALGDQMVENYGYSGPSFTAAPFNAQRVNRHYGFGASGTATLVAPDGTTKVNLTTTGGSNGWGDLLITATVPTLPAAFNCPVQQQATYGGSTAQCGQLVITTPGGTSVDTVTVTVGGKKPTVLPAGATIQSAIDGAMPGDMIIVPPGIYNEMLLMWKPVRLQGVGAASAIVDSNTQPSSKLLSPWRVRINCLFGLTPQGRPRVGTDLSCANGWTDATGGSGLSGNIDFPSIIVDRLPFEAVLGWDATLNGNLAEQLIEPSLMGAYEGAAITVLGKGVKFTTGTPTGVNDAFGAANGAAFPTNTVLLSAADCTVRKGSTVNPYPTNFYCNPSSIDGLGLRDSSQGGGGIYVHAYAHYLQVANNRIYNNLGTLSGGITVGQGEHPDLNLAGAATVLTYPVSCEAGNRNLTTNQGLPFCFNEYVNIHHNAITQNSSLGDELFSSTPAGAGGASVNTGADYYKFTNNWVCGNLSTGDGGGVAHIGWIKNGTIANNQIIFNKSSNPTIVTNGGGLLVMGAPDVDPTCGANTDQDCIPTPNQVTPSDGTGPNLTINANLILGNSAEAGSGGGVRLQNINGNDVVNFPNGSRNSSLWNSVSMTNNVIVNNVAGWDGAGVSLQDALLANIVNNTIASNDSTATAGPLFGSLFAPLSSAPTTQVGCTAKASGVAGAGGTTVTGTASCPQPSGLVSVQNSLVLAANALTNATTTNPFSCPTGHGTGTGTAATCFNLSVPLLYNDLIWHNRAFVLTVGGQNTGLYNQQNVVTLMNADPQFRNPEQPVPLGTQANTGACPTGSTFWEVGVRNDTAPNVHASNFRLTPVYSVLSDAADYPAANNQAGSPNFVSAYCNGSRTPPEAGGIGWAVPPGTNETNGVVGGTNPLVFSLLAAATVDEGNNWINMRWGPLSLTNPTTPGGGATLANYAVQSGSSAINNGSLTQSGVAAPTTDYFGNSRGTKPTIGAIQYAAAAQLSVSPTELTFSNVIVGTTSAAQTLTLSNSGAGTATGITVTTAAPFARSGGTCGATLAAGATCTIGVTFTPTGTTTVDGTLTITASVGVTGSPVALTGTGAPAITTATVTPTTLAFGNWATGTTSNPLTATVTNTGNVALAGGTFTFSATTPFTRVTTGTFPAAAPDCAATLAVGASCTIKVGFSPTSAAPFSRTLTVAYTGATVTGSPVALTGAGVGTRAAVTVTPSPLTITDASGVLSNSGTVTFSNNAAATGSSVAVTGVAVNGSGVIILPVSAAGFWSFTKGTDTCTGSNLAPGASCTVTVTFGRIGAVGTHAGTVVFTDSGSTSPTGTLTGIAQ